MSLVAIAIVASVSVLIYLTIWDLRRTFARLDERSRRPRLQEPVDLGAEIRAYKLARDVEDDRTRAAR